MDELLAEAYYVSAERRVLRRLLEVAAAYGAVAAGVTVPLTQEQLAALARCLARDRQRRPVRRAAARDGEPEPGADDDQRPRGTRASRRYCDAPWLTRGWCGSRSGGVECAPLGAPHPACRANGVGR